MENTSDQDLLKVENLSFSYNERALLKRINFSLKEGETIGIAGESGSGKTTLLKLLSGFLSPISGSIKYKGETVAGPDEQLIPGHSSIKLMNQDFDLMPFISVDENIMRNSLSTSKTQRKRMLGHYHNKLKLGKQKNQRAQETSGGQKQRVAMASTLASKPEVLLLDEPFSNLDFNLKSEIIDLLLGDWRPRGMIVVTHEPTDLLRLSDRIFVMKEGRIIQEGNPQTVFEKPVNQYAAELLGPINKLEPNEAGDLGIETTREILIRPSDLVIGSGLIFEVTGCMFAGSYFLLECYNRKWGRSIKVQTPRAIPSGDKIRIGIRKT